MFLLLLVYFKVPGQITKILDSRAQKINDELEEAKNSEKKRKQFLQSFKRRIKKPRKQLKQL
ncbi:MAG: hypothetical protein CM15mP111_3410 [Hyphomicrobiales bacterium]|nr:MAG: hypothetical protein CM15mP111_3410 [Hyphomicrobiales bacterium]